MDVWDTGDDISALASTLADPTRAKVCVTLMDGCAWTPGELAHQIDVSPQAMSSCLAHLEDAGAITRIRQGRHHYVRLSGEHMARIVESLGGPPDPAGPIRWATVRCGPIGAFRPPEPATPISPARRASACADACWNST